MAVFNITILGAGLVGCYVGGKLARHGTNVNFIGRNKIGEQVKKEGLILSDQDGDFKKLSGTSISWAENPSLLSDADIVLLCVKSADTLDAAKLISSCCKKPVTVISLQNGVGNVDILKISLPKVTVLSGMVSFNIVRFDEVPMRFHRGTAGEIVIEDNTHSRDFVKLLNESGIRARASHDMHSIMWGKLLFNLNNAVNVLSGIPLKQQLSDNNFRSVFASSVAEALNVMKAAGIKPAKTGKIMPSLMPMMLNLPNPIFLTLAQGMLKMDDSARSSMWEDLQAGRRSEIDFLNGAICSLGRKTNVKTPVNDCLLALVNNAFENRSDDDGPTDAMSGEMLRDHVFNATNNPML